MYCVVASFFGNIFKHQAIVLIRKVLKLSHFSNKIPSGKQTKQSKPKIKKDFLAKLENENASNIWAIRFVSVRAELNKVYFEYI